MTKDEIDNEMKTIAGKISNIDKDLEGTAATYSRITGYYRPVENWNDGKQEEFVQRREYQI